MPPCASQLSLYWLDDSELYLGEAACVRPSTAWFGLGGDEDGRLCLATSHLFFDNGTDSVTIFPLRAVEAATLTETDGRLRLSFTCRRAVRRAVLPPTQSQPSIPGVAVPYANTAEWVFDVPRASDWFGDALRRLVHRQRTDDVLSRREMALQAAPSAVSFRARRLVPMREQRGVLYISDSEMIFEPLFPLPVHGRVVLKAADCHHTFPRWIVFEALGLDVYASADLETAPLLSLVFDDVRERDEAKELTARLLGVPAYTASISDVSERWKAGTLSNCEYLLHLNRWSSRCLNDAFQYPVFPWVVADYTSAQLDLEAPATFRDLRKPMGALTAERLSMLRERAQFLHDAEERAYLYSTHYSSAGVVAYYLVRPHPEYQLCLQGGTLDVAERIMETVPQVWRSATANTSNFRELVPEFFSDAFAALCGPPRIDLGLHASGRAVAPFVGLPPWAATPADFVRLHRAALESDHVSRHLHAWIDLIFGVAQSGDAAVAANNVFHPFSYRQRRQEIAVPGLHLSPHEYAREFGNVPMQLFREPHPCRHGDGRAALCTAEAADTCGIATAAVERERLSQMLRELQRIEEDGHDVHPLPDVTTVAGSRFAGTAAALEEGPTAPLAGTTVRFATLGFAGACAAEPACGAAAVLLVVSDDARVVTLFGAVSGERLRSFPDFDSRATCTAHHAGSLYVFTERGSCYVISAATHAVTHCLAEIMPAAVVHASFAGHTTLLADTDGQLGWWAGAGEDDGECPLEAAPSRLCEASTPVACLGSNAAVEASVAISDSHEVFLFHAQRHEEWTLCAVPDDATVLAALPAPQLPYVWVFCRSEAAFYDTAGLPLRRVVYPPADAVLCAQVAGEVYPLCIYARIDPAHMRILYDDATSSSTDVPLPANASSRVTLSGNTLAVVSRSATRLGAGLQASLMTITPGASP